MLLKGLTRYFPGCRFTTLKKVTILHSETDNIHFNLATEEFLYEGDLKHPTLFLWRNNKTIVIGRHQNPWKQCHLNAMNNDQIALSRRTTGGGAVYHDLGNTCFSFLTPYSAQDTLDYKTVNNRILIGALSDVGVTAEVSGRNDITFDGKKISGSAYKLNLGNVKTGAGRKSLHHGTVLFKVDTQAVQKYLNPNKAKLKSKGISSVISRIMNLNEQFPHLDHDKFCEAIEKRFVQEYKPQDVDKKILNYKEFESNKKIESRFQELKSWEWLYGTTPDFQNNIETRFTWGIVDIYLNVEQGVIKKSKVYSDSIHIDYISALDELLGSQKITYDFNGVQEIRRYMNAKFPEEEMKKQTEELCEWLRTQL